MNFGHFLQGPPQFFPLFCFVKSKLIQTSQYFITILMNIKESSTPALHKQKISLCTRASQSSSSTSKPEEKLNLCKTEFSSWARSLPTEERFLALRIKLPELIQSFRMHTRQFGENWRYQCNEGKKNTPRVSKNILSLYQAFIDSIVLMTQTDYSDSIGFQFTYVESPERIYDLLASIRNIPSKTANDKINQNKPNKNKNKKIISKSEWIHQAAHQIEAQLSKKMYQKWDPKILDLEKNQKKDYANFWKNLSEEARLDFLYLGAEDFKQLIVNLVDQKIHIRPNELETEIYALLKIEKKEFCNKLFKWKLKRTSYSLCDYIELFFTKIKENLDSLKTGNNGKMKKIKRRRKNNKRTKSVDACSNDTNETEKKEVKSQLSFQELIANKLQRDFLNCVDKISEEANSYFQNRVLGYERFSYVLENLGIKTKLYGSCACGIAIKNSDLDIAIDQSALDSFEYLSTTHAKIQTFFQLLQTHLKAFKWIQIIKTIPTAYIPIIKLKIDTSIPFIIEGVPKQYFNYFNRNVKNSGPIHVDLTIQTTQQKSGLIHLGVISTQKTLCWMEEIPSLRYIVILLKNILSNKGLNETYYGGINTYTLMIMVVSFIYYAGLEKQKLFSKVFQQFLKFYGWEFDEKNYLIDVRTYDPDSIKPLQKDNYIYIKKTEKDEKSNHTAADLQILDPLNDGKVMTKNCYKFAEIKVIFRQIYEQFFVQNRKQIQKVLSESKSAEKIGKIDNNEEFESKMLPSSSAKENKYIEWMCE